MAAPHAHRAPIAVRRLSPSVRAEIVSVLCDAFHEYPVMRFVIGDGGERLAAGSIVSEQLEAYERRLYSLVDFFVEGRLSREEPVLGVTQSDRLLGAALVTPPGDRGFPETLARHREQLWTELGGAARERYAAFSRATSAFAIDRPHYHLNMIGVRRAHAGRGLARRLLDAVHELSASDAASRGVTLTTEDPDKVTLYEHFGYRRLGHVRVADDLESWGFFRADAQDG